MSDRDRNTAVVTGSTKGIGKSIGLSLLKEGYHVIFNYASSEETAEQLNTELAKSYPDQYEIIKSDLSTIEGVTNFADKVTKNHKEIHCLILNNGTTSRKTLDEITPEEWNTVLSTNLTAPLFLIQKLNPYLQQDGRIIFIGSLMGKYPHSLSISYGVSKAGVHMMAKYLVKEFAPRKITVNVIVPGFVDTPWQKDKPAEIRKSIESKVALERFAFPEEVADLCMSTIKNGYINGAELVIDGGYCYK